MYARLFVVVGVVAVIFGVGCEVAPSSDSAPAQSEPVVELQPDPEPVVEPPPEPETAWRTTQSTNLLDDSTTVVSVLEATTGTGGMIEPEPIVLVVRCSSNTTDAYINWHDFLGDDDLGNVRSTRKRVTYRFPPVAAQTEMWSVSTDNDSTFVRRAIPFLRRMVESEQLVVQTTPYNEAPSMAVFDLDGALDALTPIAETCNWVLDPELVRQEQAERDRVQQARRRAAEERRREEQARVRAEQERILAGIINRPITSGLRGPIGAGTAGLPAPVSQARFPGITAGELSRARSSGNYTIICPRGEWSGGDLTLLGCTLETD